MPSFDLGEIGLAGVSLGSPMVRVRLEVPLSREELRQALYDMSAQDVADLSDSTIRAMAVSSIVCEGLARTHAEHAEEQRMPPAFLRDPARQAVQRRVEEAFGLPPIAERAPAMDADARRRQHQAEVRQQRAEVLATTPMSDRQRQVAQLRLQGTALEEATYGEIAERLGVSTSTVAAEWRAARRALDACHQADDADGW